MGVDVVEVAGLARRLEAQPGLAAALFTPAEQAAAAASARPAERLAAAFAAKEALLKALGRGLSPAGPDRALLEVELSAGPAGLGLAVVGGLARALARRGAAAPTLALAVGGGHALATVLLLPGAPPAGRAA